MSSNRLTVVGNIFKGPKTILLERINGLFGLSNLMASKLDEGIVRFLNKGFRLHLRE